MSQQHLTASQAKTKQQIARQESRPASAQAFQGGLHPILQLQRTLGNRAVGRLLQARLAVSHPGDPDEREADRVAEQVTSMSAIASTATAQRQMMPDMEPRFGTDFSDVRVHTRSDPTQLNRSLSAQAFTHGQDMYYGAGKSPTDLRLTAHELTHVVQQNGEQMQRAQTQAKEGAAPGVAPAGREKRPLNFLSTCGNRAVGSLLRRPTEVQRAVGWPEATGWNKGGPRTIDAQHKLLRIALAGLAAGNRNAAPNTAKTAEQAADDTGARAIVWIHPNLDPTKPVQVVAHLHGLTNQEAYPFAGWRENIADPKTEESDAAKRAALEAAEKAARGDKTAKQPKLADMPNPLGNKVRDVERDRIGQQIEALGDPQVMAVLPQGTGVSKTQMFGAGFDPNAIVGEVLTRLASESEVKKVVKKYTAAPTSYTIVLSAHSAGGSALTSALSGKRTSHVGGLILFDALWGKPSKDDPKKYLSPQRDNVLAWVRAGCQNLGAVLRGSQPQDKKDAAVAALPGVRGYWTGGVYAHTYKGLQAAMHDIVDATIPSAYAVAVKAKFQVTQARTIHDRLLGEVGATVPSAAPLEEALGQRGVFVSRQVHSDSSAAAMATFVTANGLTAPQQPRLQRQPAPPRTPAQQVDDATERVRDAVRAAAAPLIGTPDGDDVVGILTQQLISRQADPRAALRRRNPTHPALPLYDVLYGTDVVADLNTIDTNSPGSTSDQRRKAADATRRRVFQAVLSGLVTDVRPGTAVAAPAAPLDEAVQIAGERAMVRNVIPFIADGRTWIDVRVGVITEFGGLIDGTRTALARANAYYGALQQPTFRNVTRNTRVHPDLNAAFVRADAMITRRLAATPEPQRTEITAAIATALGRDTFSAVLRENRNSPHRLSDHSFGFAIDIDSPRNPDIAKGGGLGSVQDVTGDDPTAGDTVNRTSAQVETTATDLRTTSDEYRAALASDATLAPVLLRLANDGRAHATPPLPALTSGAALVAAVVLGRQGARATALRAALWPEGAAAPPPAPAPAPVPRGGRRARPPAPPAPPSEIAAAERRIARVGDAFRASFTDAARTRRVAANAKGTPGNVAAHGFLSLPSILVGALAGSDAGNLRWLGTANQDFMHFELMTRPALYTAGAIVDPAPPDAAHGAAAS